VLILVVGAIFVYNAAAAGVQSRRVQFGVLRSLGWGDRALFSLVLGEQSAIGIAAGLLGTVIAIPVSRAAGFHAGAAHALLAIPAASCSRSSRRSSLPSGRREPHPLRRSASPYHAQARAGMCETSRNWR
jgi:hypothetical protein